MAGGQSPNPLTSLLVWLKKQYMEELKEQERLFLQNHEHFCKCQTQLEIPKIPALASRSVSQLEIQAAAGQEVAGSGLHAGFQKYTHKACCTTICCFHLCSACL